MRFSDLGYDRLFRVRLSQRQVGGFRTLRRVQGKIIHVNFREKSLARLDLKHHESRQSLTRTYDLDYPHYNHVTEQLLDRFTVDTGGLINI